MKATTAHAEALMQLNETVHTEILLRLNKLHKQTQQTFQMLDRMGEVVEECGRLAEQIRQATGESKRTLHAPCQNKSPASFQSQMNRQGTGKTMPPSCL